VEKQKASREYEALLSALGYPDVLCKKPALAR
jgi:hypothetical protein